MFNDVSAGQKVSQYDSEHAARLYAMYGKRALRYLRARLGRYHFDLAEDLTSETFLRVERDVRKLQVPDAQAFGWIAAIARHVVVDHHRLARNKRETPTDYASVRAYVLPPAPAAEGVTVENVVALAMAEDIARPWEVAA